MAPPRRLRSLDLFSGIGGITHGLRDIAVPIAYCDSSEAARNVLLANMSRGKLPRAPICEDVRDVGRAWLKRNAKTHRPDLLVAGFPCVGFSIAGHREGLAQDESALFYEVLRVVDETRAPMIFLENVGNILNLGMNEIAHEFHSKRGYDLRWCTLTADHVGAPQLRNRWYCLAVHRTCRTRALRKSKRYHRHRWTADTEPSRTVCIDPSSSRARFRLLGNSVVPDVIRSAFCFLANGMCPSVDFTCDAVSDINIESLQEVSKLRRQMQRWPRVGAIIENIVYKGQRPLPVDDRHIFKLEFIPNIYKPKKPPSDQLTSGRLKKSIHRNTWGTPSFGVIGPGNYLTERNSTMLHTQVRFEKRTKSRGCVISPTWVEWLMGFPRNWTKTQSLL